MTRRPPDPIEGLLSALEAIAGRPASKRQRRHFRQYLDLFIRWNRVHRMTALHSPEAIVSELFVDSLLFLKLLPDRRPLTIIDIGAGAGIPGLPMKLAEPGLVLTLVESKRKRVSFLRAACRELGLNDVTVVEGRAEAVIRQVPALVGAFDVAVSRAVSRIEELSPIALPYLRAGGVVVVSASSETRPLPGIELVRASMPGNQVQRAFLTLRK